MKLLQVFQRNVSFTINRNSISSSNTIQSNSLLIFLSRLKCFIPQFILFQSIGDIILFIYFDANSFQLYTEVFYAMTSAVLTLIAISTLSWNRIEMFKFIDSLENAIDERNNPKSIMIYKNANAFAEKWTNTVYVAMVLTIPFVSLPYMFASYYLYYTTDLGREAFVLPFIAWYD